MGLFNFSKKTSGAPGHKPYKQDTLNVLYDLLFCDDIGLYKTETKVAGYPWNVLFAKQPDVDKLKVVAGASTKDSRHKLLANTILLGQGVRSDKKELLGVVVEMALPTGLDVIAAYSDGTVRYINHAGKMTVWDTVTEASEKITEQLLAASKPVVDELEQIDKVRKRSPHSGMIRLTFLTSDGQYYWEGHFEPMQRDSLAGPVIIAATELLKFKTNPPTP